MGLSSGGLRGRVLVPGEASGRLLCLREPISFWGGVDPSTGRISDPRRAEHGRTIAGRVLAVSRTIGSSSSSAVMLELLRNGNAPVALLVGMVDAILTLGVVVAGEMGYRTIPVLQLPEGDLAVLENGEAVQISTGGLITSCPSPPP